MDWYLIGSGSFMSTGPSCQSVCSGTKSEFPGQIGLLYGRKTFQQG